MPYLPNDSFVYRATLDHLVGTTRAPSVRDLATELGLTEREIRTSFERLAELHLLVLDERTGEIEMAPPFSAVPTAHVIADADADADGDSEWFASCAWEALGVLPLLDRDGTIRSTCPDCGDRIDLEVAAGEVSGEAVFHISVPAASWWADIRFT